jgi:cell division protein ZapA (FtsZ GTPase activity inhibitor)
MNRRSWTEKLKENALVAFDLGLQLAQDQEFRTRLNSALEHSREARRRARRGRGLVGAARRLATDQALQEELRHARRDLEQAYDMLNAKRGTHRLRRITPLAGVATLAAMPQVRERLSKLVAAAARNRQQLQGPATTTASNDNGRPNTLDALTKEELYARAQEAEIPGRSEMSKDELVAALRAKS